MLLSPITTTTQTLNSVIPQDELSKRAKAIEGYKDIIIQNQGSSDIYIANGGEARIGECIKISVNDFFGLKAETLQYINIISDGSTNSNIILEIF